MSYDSFFYGLRPFIQKQDTHLRLAMTVEEGSPLLFGDWPRMQSTVLCQLFGIGISTVGPIVNNTCSVISQHILIPCWYVKMPSDGRLREVIDGYKSRWGFQRW